MNGTDKILGDLESIRLRNLQLSRDMLKKQSHWTDMEINSFVING